MGHRATLLISECASYYFSRDMSRLLTYIHYDDHNDRAALRLAHQPRRHCRAVRVSTQNQHSKCVRSWGGTATSAGWACWAATSGTA